MENDNKNTFYRGLTIEIEGKELADIFKRIEKALDEIYDCYSELKYLGIVKITKEPGNQEAAGQGVN